MTRTPRDLEVLVICDRLDSADHDLDGCLFSDDCTEPVVFELSDVDCSEPYCEQHGPVAVVQLIAMPSTEPLHIDLVRVAA